MTGPTSKGQDAFVNALIAYCIEHWVFRFDENLGSFSIMELEEEIETKTGEKYSEKDSQNEDVEELVLDGHWEKGFELGEDIESHLFNVALQKQQKYNAVEREWPQVFWKPNFEADPKEEIEEEKQ